MIPPNPTPTPPAKGTLVKSTRGMVYIASASPVFKDNVFQQWRLTVVPFGLWEGIDKLIFTFEILEDQLIKA